MMRNGTVKGKKVKERTRRSSRNSCRFGSFNLLHDETVSGMLMQFNEKREKEKQK